MTFVTKTGTEFLVNTASTGTQNTQSITSLSGGGFAVTWTTSDTSQDGNGTALKAQVFDAAGVKSGSEFLVNTAATSDQTAPSVTSLTTGGFVVTWTTDDPTQDGSSSALKAQIFDATGAKQGSEFLINTEATNSQSEPMITGLSNGGFVVTWKSADGNLYDAGSAIKAQIYDATGTKSGTEFLVNTSNTGFQGSPTITGLITGGFAIAWDTSDSTQDGSFNAIKAQIFDASGAKAGAELLVNTSAKNFQTAPTLTELSNGGFVVAWGTQDAAQDGDSTALKAQIFSTAGAKTGTELLVNTQGADGQVEPSITGLSNGSFVVTWTTNDSLQDGSGGAIKAQVFDATGTKNGGEFLVNTDVTDRQSQPVVSALTDGEFVVSWTTSDTTQDGDGTAIKAQIFSSKLDGLTFDERATSAVGTAPTDLSEIRDFDGLDLGDASDWKFIGQADVEFDGDAEFIYTNQTNGRWATVGPDASGAIDFTNFGNGGDTRVVGIYIDPEVAAGNIAQGSDTDSQRRFQNDLNIYNLTVIDAFDFDGDGFQELYFKVNDGTAYLRALMHSDGNIQYANYQSEAQVEKYLSDLGYDQTVLDTILI